MSDLFVNKQKKRTFTCLMNQPAHKPKYLKNQQSIVGSIFQVMVNEKLIISIVKVVDKDKKCKSIPIQFKVNEEDIPAEIDAYKLQRKNLINISLGKSDQIPALVVAIGDDSSDLMKCYHKFCEFSKSTKMPPIQSKTIRFLNLDGIKIKSSGDKFLASISMEKFNNFVKLVDEIKKKQKAKYNLRSKTPPPSKDSVQKNEKRFNKIVDISSDEDISKPSTSRIKAKTPPKKSNKPNVSLPADQSAKTRDSTPDKNGKIISKIQKLADITEPMESSQIKLFCEQTIRVLYSVVKNLNNDMCIKEDDTVRIIPEIDETVIRDNITIIEGVLPVYTSKYRKAIYQKSLKVGDLKPTIILANFVRYAFPPHWIHNVTFRGVGGRKSLIALWNYKNPLKTEVDGQAIPGLGEKRFTALLDHIVRKCGKKSYDKGTEKQLIACFAKAMHYSRSRMPGLSVKKPKGDEESSQSSSDDVDSSVSEEENDADDYSIEEFSEEILCTPDLKDYDFGSQESEDDLNSMFDSSTIRYDSDEKESDAVDNHSKSKKLKTSSGIVKNSFFKHPENKSQNDTENHLNEKTKDGKISQSSKRLNDKFVTKEKNILDQTNFFSQPVQSTSKRGSNDSFHSLNMKKPKFYEEILSKKKEAMNQDANKTKSNGMLSQDESRIYAKIHKEKSEAEMMMNPDENQEKDEEDDVFDDKIDSGDDKPEDKSLKIQE